MELDLGSSFLGMQSLQERLCQRRWCLGVFHVNGQSNPRRLAFGGMPVGTTDIGLPTLGRPLSSLAFGLINLVRNSILVFLFCTSVPSFSGFLFFFFFSFCNFGFGIFNNVEQNKEI